MKRSSTKSGHRDFAGRAVERPGTRSLGVIIMGGGLSLVLVTSAGMSFTPNRRLGLIQNALLIGICGIQDGQADY
jgi:hypothetical protein